MARSSRVRWRIIHSAALARQASAHNGAGSAESGVMPARTASAAQSQIANSIILLTSPCRSARDSS